MAPTDLAALIRGAATDVLAGRGLGADALPASIDLVRPRDPGHGDFSTSVALRSAGRLGVAPARLAGWLAEELRGAAGIASAEVAGPGFVNVRLTAAARGALVAEVLTAGEDYGIGPAGPVFAELVAQLDGQRVRVPGGALGMAELVAEVGPDAARYAVLRCPPGRPPRVDPALLTRYSGDNPVFAVQYGHARLCSIARYAAELGITPGGEFALLTHPREGELIRTLADFPELAHTAARRREPHLVARHLEALADGADRFTTLCRVLPLGDEPTDQRHRARVSLSAAARQVLANGLRLLGVTPEERM
ncbi:MAG TPA: DALR anticodon-binding domain-containing protein [Pseudonocardia sp.]|jgi:arginyl-tRNA synthetase